MGSLLLTKTVTAGTTSSTPTPPGSGSVNAWTGATGITASGGGTATASGTSGHTNWLLGSLTVSTGEIADGMIITGIAATITLRKQVGTVTGYYARLSLGTSIRSLGEKFNAVYNWPSTYGSLTLGGDGDLWGEDSFWGSIANWRSAGVGVALDCASMTGTPFGIPEVDVITLSFYGTAASITHRRPGIMQSGHCY